MITSIYERDTSQVKRKIKGMKPCSEFLLRLEKKQVRPNNVKIQQYFGSFCFCNAVVPKAASPAS